MSDEQGGFFAGVAAAAVVIGLAVSLSSPAPRKSPEAPAALESPQPEGPGVVASAWAWVTGLPARFWMSLGAWYVLVIPFIRGCYGRGESIERLALWFFSPAWCPLALTLYLVYLFSEYVLTRKEDRTFAPPDSPRPPLGHQCAPARSEDAPVEIGSGVRIRF